jgi:DNA-binding CsgD family transcriptional regulator
MAVTSDPDGVRPGRSRNTRLTPRQTQLVRLAADGMSAKEIARYLEISKPTVDGHFKAARERTGARNMAELIGMMYADESGKYSQYPSKGSCSEISSFPDPSWRRRQRPRGRPTVMTPDRLAAARELLRTYTVTQVASKLGISRTTLYTYRASIAASD